MERILIFLGLLLIFTLGYSLYNSTYKESECLEYETKLMIIPIIVNKTVINQIIPQKICTKYEN